MKLLRRIVFYLMVLVVEVRARLFDVDESLPRRFFDHFPNYSVQAGCRKQLARISELSAQSSKNSFKGIFASFSAGKYGELLSEDRWLHNMMLCFISNEKQGELGSFCYGYNDSRLASNAVALGICIPKKCADDRFQLLTEWGEILSTDISSLNYTSCIASRHEHPWYTNVAPMMQAAFIAMLAILALIATSYDCCLSRSQRLRPSSISTSAQLLLSFSLTRNFHKLVEFPKDPSRTITCMFGLRVISMFWTLIGHSFAWIQAYVSNVQDLRDDLSNGLFNLTITNFTLSVDTFFVLSATLTSYSWFQKQLKNSEGFRPYQTWWESCAEWLRFYRHRIVRLWPAYLYTLSTVTFLLSAVHSHAMWEPTDPAVQCRKHGWQNVLFLNSLLGNQCMGWTWYISTEFMFYLVSPIFLYTLNKSIWLGTTLSLATIAFSSILKATLMIEHAYPPSPIAFNRPSIFNGTFMQHIDAYYIKPQYRIGPYIVGILLGYVLADMHNCKKKRIADSQKLQWLLWSLCVTLILASLYGLYPAMEGWPWYWYHVVYGGIHRTVWAAGIAVLIYMCHTAQGGFVNTLLSARVFLPLSSLCYSVYLIHLVMVFAVFLWVPSPITYTGKLPILMLCLGQLALSFFSALPITMLTEFPALNIEKILLRWSSIQTGRNTEKAYPLILKNKH
uniref:Nose resistant to fluoxetine protein 6 n=1 Tax=Ascaris suum TaxID=6253 RepID=F1KZY2_ASCSU